MSKKVRIGHHTKEKGKLSSTAIVAMAFLIVFNISNIVNNYQKMGLSEIWAFGLAALLFMLPFTFIMAEMASMKKAENAKSGLSKWVELCIGRRTGFITAYLFWFANIIYMSGSIPGELNNLLYMCTGKDMSLDPLYSMIAPFATVALFALFTWMATLNVDKLVKWTNMGGILLMGLIGLFMLSAFVGLMMILGGNNTILPNNEVPWISGKANMWGESGGFNFQWISSFIWILLAYDGVQALGCYAGNMKNGSRGFIKGIIWATIMLCIVYVGGSIFITVFPPVLGDQDISLADNTYIALYNMYYFILSPTGMSADQILSFTFIFMGFIWFFSSIGTIMVFVIAPVRTLLSDIPQGVFGSSLSKKNRHGNMAKGVWINWFIIAIIIILPAIDIPGIGGFMEFMRDACAWVDLIPCIVIFSAYFNLRLKHDDYERHFKFGNRTFGLIMSATMVAIFATLMIITVLGINTDISKPMSEWPSNWWENIAFRLGTLIVMMPPAFYLYTRWEKKTIETKICKMNKWNESLLVYKYSITSKARSFLYTALLQKQIDEKEQLLNKYNDKFSIAIKLINQKEKIRKLKIKRRKELTLTRRNHKAGNPNGLPIANLEDNTDKRITIISKIISNQINWFTDSKIKVNYQKEKQNIMDFYDKEIDAINSKVNITSEFKKLNKARKIDLKNLKIKHKNEMNNEHLRIKTELNSLNIKLNPLYTKYKKDKYFHNKVEDINLPIYIKDYSYDGEVLKEEMDNFKAIRKLSFYTSRNILDSVEINQSLKLIHKTDYDYKVKEFDINSITVSIANKSKSIKRLSQGKTYELDLVTIISGGNNNVWIEDYYVHNAKEFQIKILKQQNLNRI